MSGKTRLQLISQPQEFFYELLTDALGRRALRPTPETEFYLVNLLNQFMTTDALYMRDANGHYREEPLALMMKEALETSEAELKKMLFRQVGDVSLYVAGFFQHSLTRKLVDLDYYIGMGGGAYQQVASRADEEKTKVIFEELAHRFGSFVDVLADVSDQTTLKSEKNLLQLYDLWSRTGSERAAKSLQEEGIIPKTKSKKDDLN